MSTGRGRFPIGPQPAEQLAERIAAENAENPQPGGDEKVVDYFIARGRQTRVAALVVMKKSGTFSASWMFSNVNTV
jgi:hypothetical protein